MQLHALRAGLGLAISSSLMLFASLSYASKHTARNTPAAKQGDTHHPKNWRFTMPKGDPAKGRAVFEKFECYYCHESAASSFLLLLNMRPS
jgi:hypothetical protein